MLQASLDTTLETNEDNEATSIEMELGNPSKKIKTLEGILNRIPDTHNNEDDKGNDINGESRIQTQIKLLNVMNPNMTEELNLENSIDSNRHIEPNLLQTIKQLSFVTSTPNAYDTKVVNRPKTTTVVLFNGRDLDGNTFPFYVRLRGDTIMRLKKNDHEITNNPEYLSMLRKAEKIVITKKLNALDEWPQIRTFSESFVSTSKEHQNHLLWVDKYKPKKFTELLAVHDDPVYLEVLKWTTQWKDFIQFQRIKHKKPFANNQVLPIENKICSPPSPKILLIGGPPGLGKTTLAHVISKTAGFETVEINGSDERSGDRVIRKVKVTLEAEYSMKMGQRPNLLIIDEIDGSTAGEGVGGAGFTSDKVILNTNSYTTDIFNVYFIELESNQFPGEFGQDYEYR